MKCLKEQKKRRNLKEKEIMNNLKLKHLLFVLKPWAVPYSFRDEI